MSSPILGKGKTMICFEANDEMLDFQVFHEMSIWVIFSALFLVEDLAEILLGKRKKNQVAREAKI